MFWELIEECDRDARGDMPTKDRLIATNRKFRDMLSAKYVRFTPIETPGMHTWMVWRRNLANLAPLLFQ